jgi:hypothetical protein
LVETALESALKSLHNIDVKELLIDNEINEIGLIGNEYENYSEVRKYV